MGLHRVRAGTLDDTSWLRPSAHFRTRGKQPWITLPEGDQIFETQPSEWQAPAQKSAALDATSGDGPTVEVNQRRIWQ
jgi:hypothetical protein